MKKTLFILALVALVIGSVYAGSVIGAPAVRTSGPVQMQIFAGPPTVVPALGAAILLQQSFGQVRHISVTAPAGTQGRCGNVWAQVQADMNGDGVSEYYSAPVVDGGCFLSIYEFDAYGFRVVAFNDQTSSWTTQAHATVTCF